MILRTISLLAFLTLAGPASADVVTDRWGAAASCRHAGTVSYLATGAAELVMKFDLSALPPDTRILRARLLPQIRIDGVPLAEPIVLRTLSAPAARGSAPLVSGEPLELVGPRFRSFDATEVVRRWVSGKAKNHGLSLRGAAVDQARTCLEITYEGQLTDPPPPVTGLKAFYRLGQVFLTWNEINTPFLGKQEVRWKELKAELDRIRDGRGPIVAYRIYRHTRPITAQTLAQADLLDEVAQHSAFDEREIKTEWKGEQEKNVRVAEAPVPRTAVEEKSQLPIGTGVWATTCRNQGEFYYAVIATVDGLENTVRLDAGNTAGPLRERIAPTEPVLFRTDTLQYQKRDNDCYVWWLDPPLAHLPTFVHLSISPSPKADPEPRPFFVNNWWWSSGWSRTFGCPVEEGVSLNIDQNCMQVRGIHDGCGTYKSWSQGKVQNYFIRQFRALLPWIQRKYGIDPDRMFAFSSGWGWHYGDLFAASFECTTMNPKRSPAGMECKRYWNDPKTPAPTEWGTSAWEYWNAGEWIKNHPTADLPLITYTTRMHTGDFGILDKPPLYRALLDGKHCWAAIFDEGTLYGVVDPAWIFQLRRTHSLAAFGNCSLDDDPGIGFGGDPGGQMNAYLCFDAPSQVDQPARWEMTLYLQAGDKRGRNAAPRDCCTVDVTPRRCRHFQAQPGQKFTWTNTSLAEDKIIQTGTATADAWGLVTAPKVLVSKSRNRLVIEKAK